MKRRTIAAIIAKKFKNWIETIEDSQVRNLVEKNSIVTGGCIASMLLNEQVNDFDFYFRNRETALAVANYYVEQFKKEKGSTVTLYAEAKEDRVSIVAKGDQGNNNIDNYFERTDPDATDPVEYAKAILDTKKELDEDDEKPRYRPVFLSTNAITLTNNVQVVIRFFGEPDQIHDNYDFVHVTNYWTSWDKQVVVKPEALEALLSKELRYMGSKYPLCSIIRIRKFIKRGWTINAGQILKMCMQVHALNLTDPLVLKEQLVGVDMAYFIDILEKLREKNAEKVDVAYLTEIIDRMF